MPGMNWRRKFQKKVASHAQLTPTSYITNQAAATVAKMWDIPVLLWLYLLCTRNWNKMSISHYGVPLLWLWGYFNGPHQTQNFLLLLLLPLVWLTFIRSRIHFSPLSVYSCVHILGQILVIIVGNISSILQSTWRHSYFLW